MDNSDGLLEQVGGMGETQSRVLGRFAEGGGTVKNITKTVQMVMVNNSHLCAIQ